MKPLSLILALAAALAIPGAGALASSHREAPFITQNPKVDATDFYMFTSYEAGRSNFVTLIANYVPLQDAYGGPNYFAMDPNALYEIHVDNNGDAREDITFQFRFTNTLRDTQLTIGSGTNSRQVSIPLVNSGSISASGTNPGTAALNVTESYNVTVVRGNRRSGNRQQVTNAAGGSTSFAKPVDNIGNKSIPNYKAYADSHVYNITIPGCTGVGRMFVGQRKDSFVVNLGETFDLINTAPTGPVNGEIDDLADKNVTTLALELPKSCLTNGSETVVGAWTTASLRQARVLRPTPGNTPADYGQAAREGGAWLQVSRLGMPLVNEVVIGLRDKDRFNASRPENDGRFIDYVTHPTLPALIQELHPAPAPTNFPRNDLVAVFLTGVSGLNQPAGVTGSEMLRLNTSTPIAPGAQNNLGVIAGDNAGFPNGRRPGDDVVDIALRVVMGAVCTLDVTGCPAANVQTIAPAGTEPLTDGALVNSSMFTTTFPYLCTPIPGSPSNAPFVCN